MRSNLLSFIVGITVASLIPAQAQVAEEAAKRTTPRISPDNEPPCASPVPPPMTSEQMAAYRARLSQPRPPLPPATTATQLRAGVMAKHQCFLEVAKRGGIDLLFVGDSITDFFGRADRGRDVWMRDFAPLRAANFGISGDTTQDVLWRMQNGELEGFEAKLIVLMLGTNNIGRNDPADIAAGDAAVIAEFRKRQPKAKILLLGIFPRGEDPAGPTRGTVREINTHLAKLADGQTVLYLDIAPAFLNADGTLKKGAMVDGLHPGPAGYAMWSDAILPTVRQLMQ